MLKIIFSIFISVNSAFAINHRISSKLVDLGKVHTIFMNVGMVTMIEIPGNVTGVRCGNPAAVNYIVPENPKNEVSLVLREKLPRPTNLIIRSGSKKYVFDLIPSTSLHQDEVIVSGSFGGPVLIGGNQKVIESSSKKGKI